MTEGTAERADGSRLAAARRIAAALGASFAVAAKDVLGGGAARKRSRRGDQAGPERRGATKSAAAALYRAPRSFVDHLPWAEALDDGTIVLDDGRSAGGVWEIVPVGTEGRDADWLGELRDGLQEVLQDAFEEFDAAPWVVQTYTWRELDLSAASAEFRRYAGAERAEDAFSAEYASILDRHYRGVARPGGLFRDRLSQTSWGAARQRTFVVVYRWAGRRGGEAGPEGRIDETGDKLMRGLQGIGVRSRRVSGAEFHAWLSSWFNAYTHLTPDSPAAFSREFLDGGIPYGDDFAESLLYCHPRSDAESGTWRFDRTAARVVTVEGVRKPPAIGHVTGETRRGDAVNALLDRMPEGTVYVTTLVPVPQDTIDAHVDRIASAATGDAADAARARADCGRAKAVMGDRHKLYRLALCFYLRAPSGEELEARTGEALTVLLQHGFRVVAPGDDVRALDNYLANLPMAYRADLDRQARWRRARLAWVQHAANLWPVFGRSTGTGHPAISFFNRGGEPLSFDPWNKLDRQANAHGLLVGPTGAGKSATLGAMLAQAMAVHRPRLFVIEAGNSFGLLADWFEAKGLSVNRVALRPGSPVSLAPFADAARLPEVTGIEDGDGDAAGEPDEAQDEESDEDDGRRDVLGELETVATLMVTGGEPREIDRLRFPDRRAIRDAVIAAGKAARAAGRDPLAGDVRDAFAAFARERTELPEESRQRLREMGDAVGLFCDGFAGDVFNRPGETWPEADVTLVDLGHFARVDYQAHLAIAAISLLNVVNNLAERDQRSEREIVVAIDEAHIVTTHPLVCPHIVKVVKMWRKLGAWLWLATQNLEDFPGTARKLLNMMEWWICLVLPPDEVAELSRFREVSDSQRELLLSAAKADLQYTEGVVMSRTLETLFRAVPPSMLLALVQTERHEKARRAELQREHGLETEIEAVYLVAAEIDEARGIAR